LLIFSASRLRTKPSVKGELKKRLRRMLHKKVAECLINGWWERTQTVWHFRSGLREAGEPNMRPDWV